MNLWLIFLTGLTVGGLTCLAVQGGLLASVLATQENVKPNSKKHILLITFTFLISKLIAYTILGYLLGGFGSALNIGGKTQSIMQLIAGIYMIFVAMDLLKVHPFFRYFILQPPRFLTRLVRNESKSKDIFAPAFLGAMTVFIPCGTTLAIETLAISSSNALNGASIMAVFTLGTIPLFFTIGVITSFFGEKFKSSFLKIAAILVIYIGIISINGSLLALNSPLTIQSITKSVASVFGFSNNQSNSKITNSQNISIKSNGYSPKYIRVKKGEEVNLTVTNDNAYSCASAFRIPSLGLGSNIAPGQKQVFKFTPKEKGQILFTCSMGMYSGIIEVL